MCERKGKQRSEGVRDRAEPGLSPGTDPVLGLCGFVFCLSERSRKDRHVTKLNMLAPDLGAFGFPRIRLFSAIRLTVVCLTPPRRWNREVNSERRVIAGMLFGLMPILTVGANR